MIAALPLLLISVPAIQTCPGETDTFDIVMPTMGAALVPTNTSIWLRGRVNRMASIRSKTTEESVPFDRMLTPLSAAPDKRLMELRLRTALEPDTDYEIVVAGSVREVIRTSTVTDLRAPAEPVVLSVKTAEDLRPYCGPVVVVELAPSADTLFYLYERGADVVEIGANFGFLNPNHTFAVTDTAALTVVAVDLTGQRSRPVPLPAPSGTVGGPAVDRSFSDGGCICVGASPRGTGRWTVVFMMSLLFVAFRRRR